jgi:hypothetical protein
VQLAREEGPSVIQAFHESIDRKDALNALICDVCAFANTNGGTLYVGVAGDKNKKPAGINNPKAALEVLEREIRKAIAPPVEVEMDILETQGKSVVRVQVPFGDERPYAIEQSKIYVRDEAETNLAWRDEIVMLVQQGLALRGSRADSMPVSTLTQETQAVVASPASPHQPPPADAQDTVGQQATGLEPPRSGVEIVDVEERDGTRYYTMRDLRNSNVVRNVTRSSARLLWHYAIKQTESEPLNPNKVVWHGNAGLVRRYVSKGDTRFELAQRMPDGSIRVYYGVNEDAIQNTPWQVFLTEENATG